MDLAGLLARPPGAHLDAAGNRVPWQIAPRVLEVIDSEVGPESRTLETGAGFSTGLFAIKRCEHTCVVPFTSEIERLKSWGEDVGVPFDTVDFQCGLSEVVLPKLPDAPLDFVLIDGGHGFPTPFIDWWYAGRRLRKDGLLAIDDTELWTGRILMQFLKNQPGWEVVESLPLRAVIFRRTADPSDSHEEWVDQPFVVRRSFVGGPRGAVRKVVRGAALVRARVKQRGR
jgi:hypothetical protein